MKAGQAKFGPWPNGVDNIHEPNNVQVDQFGNPQSLVDAVNVDISYDGYPATRKGTTLRVSVAGAHSIYETSVGTYYVYNSYVYRLNNDYTTTQIGKLNTNDLASYDDHLGGVIVSNRTSLMRITAAGLFAATVTDGVEAAIVAATSGGLPAGTYGVACPFINVLGLEGSLPPIQFIDVPAGGGIRVTAPTAPDAVSVRLFRTGPNGKVLMRAADVAPGAVYLIGADSGDGKEPVVAPERMAKAMPPGDFVNNWRSRCLIARGRNLYFSEPFAYHLNSTVFGFVQFPRKINFVRGVQEGVFVGTREDVIFLPGEQPAEWKQVSTGGQPAAARGAIVTDGSNLDKVYNLNGQNIAVWLSTSGFVLGTGSGSIIEPQAERFKNALPQQASIALDDRRRRLIAVVT